MTVARGTSNTNDRGSAESRRRRREWLLATYRADVDVDTTGLVVVPRGQGRPACRCYRCGVLMVVEQLTVDRIVPGCQGGTYRRTNIRPCCPPCNSATGAVTRKIPRQR